MPPQARDGARKPGPVKLTPEQRREHVIDFAYSNAVLENPRVTQEMVRRAFDRLHAGHAEGR